MVDVGKADVAMRTWQSAENRLEQLGRISVYAVHGSLAGVIADAVVSTDDARGAMISRSASKLKSHGGAEIEFQSMTTRHQLGEAWLTSGGKLGVKHVIHVAVLDAKDRTTGEIISKAMACSLQLADRSNMQSVAYPALGTGRSGFDVHASTQLSRRALREHVAAYAAGSLTAVGFVLYSPENYREFCASYRATTQNTAGT